MDRSLRGGSVDGPGVRAGRRRLGQGSPPRSPGGAQINGPRRQAAVGGARRARGGQSVARHRPARRPRRAERDRPGVEWQLRSLVAAAADWGSRADAGHPGPARDLAEAASERPRRPTRRRPGRRLRRTSEGAGRRVPARSVPHGRRDRRDRNSRAPEQRDRSPDPLAVAGGEVGRPMSYILLALKRSQVDRDAEQAVVRGPMRSSARGQRLLWPWILGGGLLINVIVIAAVLIATRQASLDVVEPRPAAVPRAAAPTTPEPAQAPPAPTPTDSAPTESASREPAPPAPASIEPTATMPAEAKPTATDSARQ